MAATIRDDLSFSGCTALMSFLRRYRVGVVVAVLLVTAGGFALFWTRTQQARGATRTRPDPLVGIVAPQRRTIEVKLSFTADILPIKQAALFSKVSGYIRKIYVERGDLVKKGNSSWRSTISSSGPPRSRPRRPSDRRRPGSKWRARPWKGRKRTSRTSGPTSPKRARWP